eukprot:750827-Hanusia_phi.AAC.1
MPTMTMTEGRIIGMFIEGESQDERDGGDFQANLHQQAKRAHLKAIKSCKKESKRLRKEERRHECLLALGRYLESLQRECDWSKWDQYVGIEGDMLNRTLMERVLTPFQVNKGPFSLHALRNLTEREARKKIPETALPLPSPPPQLPPLRVGMLWTGTYDSEFANNLISVFEMDPTEVQRPDDGAKHEGVECASSMRKYHLHMLLNLPGWLNEATMSVSAAVPCALQARWEPPTF